MCSVVPRRVQIFAVSNVERGMHEMMLLTFSSTLSGSFASAAKFQQRPLARVSFFFLSLSHPPHWGFWAGLEGISPEIQVNNLKVFNRQKLGCKTKKSLKSPEFYTRFSVCSQIIKGWWKIFISCFVYSQIWPNLPRSIITTFSTYSCGW